MKGATLQIAYGGRNKMLGACFGRISMNPDNNGS